MNDINPESNEISPEDLEASGEYLTSISKGIKKTNEISKITREGVFNFIEKNYPDGLQMTEYLEMVKEFHKTFGVPVHDHPNQFSANELELRINLLQEELNEMKDYEDYKSLLDALCDLQYVLSGAILQLGFSKVFDDAFRAVHESNMSKVIKDTHSVELEMYEYKKKGIPCYKEMVKEGWIIKRSSDGKVLKPSGYTPVDLSIFLEVLDNS